MDELQKLIEKWDEQIALHRRVCDDPIMYTKEDRLQNSHYAQAICAVVADLKKLTIHDVVGRSESFVCGHPPNVTYLNEGVWHCEKCGGKWNSLANK